MLSDTIFTTYISQTLLKMKKDAQKVFAVAVLVASCDVMAMDRHQMSLQEKQALQQQRLKTALELQDKQSGENEHMGIHIKPYGIYAAPGSIVTTGVSNGEYCITAIACIGLGFALGYMYYAKSTR